MASRVQPEAAEGPEKQIHLGTAADNQVEQCSEEKVDCRRFVSQEKVWPFETIIACQRCIDVTVTDRVPILICPAKKIISVYH